MSERDEFAHWLRKNRVHFKLTYTPMEVVEFARMNGFPDDLIFPILSSFDHALCGMDPDKTARQHTNRFKETLEDLGHAPNFREQWSAVNAYLYEGKDFDEKAKEAPGR